MSDLTAPVSRAARRALVPALLALAAGPLSAQVTPTHTFETPMVFDPFTSSVVFATMIAPPAGEHVVGALVELDWTTDGTQSAALFGMHLHGNTVEGSIALSVIGADQGWGAAAGTWSTSFLTDDLNGTTQSFLPGFPSTLDLVLEAAGGGGLWGTLEPSSRILFLLGPDAKADTTAVSLAAGGTQTLSLNAGPTVGPGLLHLVVGSASGAAPGFDVDGVHVPLVPDAYLDFTIVRANKAPFVGTLGTFDANGQATAAIVVPRSTEPSLAGVVLHHACAVVDPFGAGLLSVSAPVPLTLLP